VLIDGAIGAAVADAAPVSTKAAAVAAVAASVRRQADRLSPTPVMVEQVDRGV
jgi:hypothetical protein